MKPIEVGRQKQRLDNLFERIATFSGDPELQSHWSRYLCVLVSGYLETSVRAIYREYVQKRADPSVLNFVDSQLNEFRNPNMRKILELAHLFNPQWESQIKVATDGQLKEAVDSIVANRHKIAHGDDVGITYTRIRDYYLNAVKVVDLLSKEFNR